MTTKEFDNQGWTVGMKCKHYDYDQDWDIATVIFPERLVGVIKYDDEDEIMYFRCENVELLKVTSKK